MEARALRLRSTCRFLPLWLECIPARALSITDRPTGTLVYVALGDLGDEDAAFEQMANAQAELGPGIPVKLVTVPTTDWERLNFSEGARIYSL